MTISKNTDDMKQNDVKQCSSRQEIVRHPTWDTSLGASAHEADFPRQDGKQIRQWPSQTVSWARCM
jgi:hypothetical protein